MKILLLSAYDAQSHQYWRKGLVHHFPEYEWTVLTLSPRYFSWRLRGNSLSWAFGHREVLQQPYDLIIATSMTDLSSLKGMVPALAAIPTICYFHENQFAYPESGRQKKSVEPEILNLYTALSADCVLFNTDYNRDTMIEGALRLLKKLPDCVPDGIIERLESCSSVLPVPLADDLFLDHHRDGFGDTLQIVFNHRWEYDKAPERMYEALKQLSARDVDFTIHVVGQRFRQVPPVFAQLQTELRKHIGSWGYIESEKEYRTLLQASDIVLSTAIHDFQGIAVLEAVAAGCRPVVPDRLAYPELFPDAFRYSSFLDDIEAETIQLVDHLESLAKLKYVGNWPDVPDVEYLSWESLKPRYRYWLESVAGI